MIALSQARMKRLTAVHGWCAVVLGLLLYAVVATGAVAVFAEEIGRWSSGTVREDTPLAGPLDSHLRRLAAEVDPAVREDLGFWAGTGTDVHAFFHTHRLNPDTGAREDFGTMFRFDAATGEVLSRHDGFIWRIRDAWDDTPLARFLVELHVQLYLPDPWGLILTGILGLMMMVAVVSGLLIHRHLLRDLFLPERPGGRLVGVRDRHALASAWSLPFAFLLAFTGSFFSFAATIGLPIVATVAFGGDQERMTETLFEAPPPEDRTPAAAASLDAIIASSTARAGSAPGYVDVAHLGRADARVSVWHDPRPGGLGPVANRYDGATQAFLGQAEPLGTRPSLGGSLYGLMGPLHFGNFAGLLSKAVWGALGVAMCFVILSGFRLWVRRRADEPGWRHFGLAVAVTGYGLPLAMLAAGWGFFLSRPAADPHWWTPAGFFAAAAAVLLHGAVHGVRAGGADRLGPLYQRWLGLGCLSLPMLRVATGGMDWAEAATRGQSDVLTLDLLLLIGGLVLLWCARGAAAPDPAPRMEAAE